VVDAAPFPALRYDPAVAGDPAQTSAPAYDDLERFTYAQARTASPYTVLELLTGEDDDTDGYRAAAATFHRWLRTAVLVEDDEPAYFAYEIHELRHGIPGVLRGVLAAVAVEGDTLLPHEHINPARVTARVRRLAAVPADLAPVFAVHTPAPEALRALLDAQPRTPPVVAFTDESGTDHRVWALREGSAIATVRDGLAGVRAVIADGHHRFAAAAERNAGAPTAGRTLTYLVDGSAYGPHLHAIHRHVDAAAPDLLRHLAPHFEQYPVPLDALEEELRLQRGVALGLVGADGAWLLVAKDGAALRSRLPAGHTDAWTGLDAAVWEHAVLPLLGSVTVAYRSDLAAGARDLAAAGGSLFVLRAPTIDEVFACAFAGEAMPAKSTSFRPKPRAGLVMRSLDLLR
jgi:hypothetical protein